jgi:hypothetical protein
VPCSWKRSWRHGPGESIGGWEWIGLHWTMDK